MRQRDRIQGEGGDEEENAGTVRAREEADKSKEKEKRRTTQNKIKAERKIDAFSTARKTKQIEAKIVHINIIKTFLSLRKRKKECVK